LRAALQIDPRSYVGRLLLALTGLVVPTTVLALLGWHVLAESQYRVERGRIANDIYNALLSFDLEKSSLRNWSYRRALDQQAGEAERLAYLDAMRQQIAKITDMAELAAASDHVRGKVLPEHGNRLSMLEFLADAVEQLDIETRNLPIRGEAEPSLFSTIDSGFDQLRGASFAETIRIALSSEAEALTQERARANRSLASARKLFLSAAGFGLVATFAMALLLARRLRQPFRELETGLKAYEAGDFSYRFTVFRDREFVDLGVQLNAMATEVEFARRRAAENRAELEQTVTARTIELRQTLDALSASQGARQRLLADISHELRTPVTAIRGEAQVALRGKSDDPDTSRLALTRIVEISRQMGRLIEDLLVLVRDPESVPDIQAGQTNLADMLMSALDLARSIATQRDVTLHTPDPLPCMQVWADPDRLRQVVICLLDNAIRYSHAGGDVWLRLDLGDTGMVRIEISDQGIGIDVQDVQHVFDRGWRSSAARAHRPDGLGLGLAIARQLIVVQGGTLTLRPGDQGLGVVAVLEVPTKPDTQSRSA
jgi:two-component system, OmpR family, sensor kinase